MGGMDEMMDGMGGWMLVWPVVGLVLVALVVAVVVRRVRARPGDRQISQQPATEAREILERRYASGEIDEDEYFRRISGLDQS